MENFKMVAKTFFGFEEILAKELQQLGAQKIEQGTRVVSFMGDKGFMYKANLALRTAIKILKPIKTFKAFNEKGLYNGIQGIDWSAYLNEHQTFVVETTLHSDMFTHSQFVALKTKDAIVDQFREKTGKRPNIDKDFPDLRIHIHIDRDLVTVSLDTSGASLHHRGYRSATNIA
ncbi:MAG: class I SAM-dependent RNA methyltransferase, partial [Flavobacteriaceae bacterium]|nr:class I SAM-dependent RNA methyltransferase [Flavobacteriaceae bacterium]